MRNLITVLLLTISIVHCNGVLVLGRGTQPYGVQPQGLPEDPKLSQLREAVRRLEEKDKQPDLPPTIKALNRQILDEARQALIVHLRESLNALREYQADPKIKAALDSLQMSQTLENQAQAYEKEIQSLTASSPVAAAVKAPPPAEDKAPASDKGVEVASKTVAATEEQQKPKTPDTPGESSATPAPISKVAAELSRAETVTTGTMEPSSSDFQDCAKFDEKNPKTFSLFARYVCHVAADIEKRKDSRPDAGFNVGRNFLGLVLVMIARRDRPAFLVEAEEARTDKQVGGGPSSSGSTSLTLKGGVPSVLGLAVENGALSQSVSGTTVTFRGSPYGIVQALAKKGYIESYNESQRYAITKFLRDFSFSLSFDTSRGTQTTTATPGDMTNVLTADKQQLSAATFRYLIINHRDPRRDEYKAEWEKFLADQADPVAELLDKIAGGLLVTDTKMKDPALQQWYKETNEAMKAASKAQVRTVLQERLSLLPINALSTETVDLLNRLKTSFEGYLKARNAILDTIAKGTIVSFEYASDRQVNAPNLSTFTLIAEKGLGGRFDGTFNGSLTMFDKIPTGMTRRVRDFSFAGQGDIGLGDVRGIGNLVLSFSGRYERLMENAMTPDGMAMMNTKGDLLFGQAKLTIPVKGLGAKMPISVTFSNRTELIKEKEVKGNIGFTFDLDSIFAKFKP